MSLLKRIFRNKFFYLAVVLEIFSMFYPHTVSYTHLTLPTT